MYALRGCTKMMTGDDWIKIKCLVRVTDMLSYQEGMEQEKLYAEFPDTEAESMLVIYISNIYMKNNKTNLFLSITGTSEIKTSTGCTLNQIITLIQYQITMKKCQTVYKLKIQHQFM